MQLDDTRIGKIFAVFIFLHVAIWTLIPSLTNLNLPLDTIEHLAWASNLDWGYDKHPPMVAYILNIFYQIFGNNDWAYYLLCQLFMASTFFIVWIFSKDFFQNRIHSLISVLLLQGVFFYNFTTPEFNVNVCMFPFWALCVLFCWRGINYNRTRDWLLFGFFAALGFLSKYLFIYLLASLGTYLLFLLIRRELNFKCLIALMPFSLVLLPHLFWLIDNDFITIRYAFFRSGTEDQNFLNHLSYPMIYLVDQFLVLVPFLVMFSFLIVKQKIKVDLKDKPLQFLFAINLLPVLLMFLTSMLMAVRIRTMWMAPLFLFSGVFLIYLFQTSLKPVTTKSIFTAVFLIFSLLFPAVYAYISVLKTQKRTDYAGAEIAGLVQQKWQQNFNQKIGLVVGNEWQAGNLSYHLESRPIWHKPSSLYPDHPYFSVLSNRLNFQKYTWVIVAGSIETVPENSPLARTKPVNQRDLGSCSGVYFQSQELNICLLETLVVTQ